MSGRQKIVFLLIYFAVVDLSSLSPLSKKTKSVFKLKQHPKESKNPLNKTITNKPLLGLSERRDVIGRPLKRDFVKKSLLAINEKVNNIYNMMDTINSSLNLLYEPVPTVIINHDEHNNCVGGNCESEDIPSSCEDAMEEKNTAGAYLINPLPGELTSFYVYCTRQNDRAWMVIQRRTDGSVNFYRNWYYYKHGFGNVNNEYWIGLERLHKLTKEDDYELMVEMVSFRNVRTFAHYNIFAVSDEEDLYTLTLHHANGNITDKFLEQDNEKFSTYDYDNDDTGWNCAQQENSGWWFSDCSVHHNEVNLNGLYFSLSNQKSQNGIHWYDNTDQKYMSLQYVQMSISLYPS